MNLHRAIPSGALAAVAGLALSACTAFNVVTHTTSLDPVDAPSGVYTLDPDHAGLRFGVDHLGFSRFSGRFDEMTATLEFDAARPEQSRLQATIRAASLDTPLDPLNELLAGPEFFDAARYPEIRFRSLQIAREGPTQGTVTGELSLHGRARPVTLHVIFNGGAPNPLTGRPTLGFSADGILSRAGFGLNNWFPAVGDEVRFHIEAEFVLKEER